MEFKDFGHATMIPICNRIFWNFFDRWEIQKAFQQAITRKILTLFAKVMCFLFFLLNEGMLSATAIAPEFAQNIPKQPNFVKICPKTISLKNFEIPPKIQIIIFFSKNNNLVCRGRTNACSHCLDFFSMFHTLCKYEIL